ncbi:alpha/beta hydrolase, partial [Corynebacterium bovis]|uniref:alpha/beta fold hydrolase n=2 Tax=Corynebacterium bovis TaxID=36808 RepID=UPI003139AB32
PHPIPPTPEPHMSPTVFRPQAVLREWWHRVSPVTRARSLAERRRAEDPTEEPGLTDVDRTGEITTDDGVHLRYYDIGPEDAPVTVVFSHGFTLTSQSFFLQVRHLRRIPGVRCVLSDTRGHGQTRLPESVDGFSVDDQDRLLTVEATGRDLVRVIDELVPTGRIVLVGHSLGAQTVFAGVRLMDDAVRRRIAGIVVVNGAVGAFSRHGVTRLLGSRAVRAVWRAGDRILPLAAVLKRSVAKLVEPTLATVVFHEALDEGESSRHDIVAFHASMINETSVTTILGFLDELATHSEAAVGPLLAGIPGVAIAGRKDAFAPVALTEEIARVWPDVPGHPGEPGVTVMELDDTGHMVILERPEDVTRAIRGLVDDALGDAGAGAGEG